MQSRLAGLAHAHDIAHQIKVPLSMQGLRKLCDMSADACGFRLWSMLRVSVAVQDFLVRGLIGFDQSTGAMAVGEGVRVGQRLRFMVRDRDGAMRDLNDHGLALKRRQLQVHAASLHPHPSCTMHVERQLQVHAASLHAWCRMDLGEDCWAFCSGSACVRHTWWHNIITGGGGWPLSRPLLLAVPPCKCCRGCRWPKQLLHCRQDSSSCWNHTPDECRHQWKPERSLHPLGL